MEYHELKRDIEAGRLAPAYFFFGEESYHTDVLTASIVRRVVTPETRDFNCDIFQSEEADVEQVLAAATSYPMMAERRVVVLKSIQKLPQSDKDKLLAHVRRSISFTTLVLTAGKIDRRQQFYSSLLQAVQWAEFKPMYDNQAAKWVENRFKEAGFSVAPEAAELLVRLTGTSLWNLANEIEKTITYCWGKDRIDAEQVAEIAGYSRKYNTWEFSDSIGRKQFDDALHVLNRLMQEKHSPAGLIMELSRKTMQLMQIRILLDRNMSFDQIRTHLGMNAYFLKLTIEQARHRTLLELEKANRSLLKADLCIKTGGMDPLVALTMVAHDLIYGETRGRFFC